MTTNNDLFVRPPARNPIPNDGVSQVGRPAKDDAAQWDVLRYELENFVCEGEYAEGLERILGSYLRNTGQGTQAAVWVSGFYGSGKSHLLRVLEHLWTNTELPDGASARGLVSALPQDVRDHLTELDQTGARFGSAPWSAAGELEGDDVYEAFLAVVLEGAGLPRHIGPARVALWLIDEGIYDAVMAHVSAAGKDPAHELRQFHVSSTLADGVLAALPTYAESAAAVRAQFKAQFRDQRILDASSMLELLDRVLRYVGGGEVPPTLVVLDEVQAYINDHGGETLGIQNLVQAVTKEMGNRILLVGTGQQEMTADAALQKIRDRFTVRVLLKDTDVDAVVRRVVLSKDPSLQKGLEATLERASAEVYREVSDTRIAHAPKDDETLAADYPLLPTRRRFWEKVLREVDFGRAGQLRSQLRIVHDAAVAVSDKPVGTVIGADYLYDAKNEDLNQTSQLSKGLQRQIAEQRDLDPLRGRILALIHLISLLPTTKAQDSGIRATALHLADLLVEDLADDGARLRAAVPQLLVDMADEGIVQEDAGEYRLQTEAGRDWEDAYRNRRVGVTSSEVSAKRDELLRAALDEVLPRQVAHGAAKVSRKVRPDWSDEDPSVGDEIPAWIRSEWDGVTAKQFEELARTLGSESSVVLLHIPRAQATEFEHELKKGIAADRVLSERGTPQDDDGQHAHASMASRRQRAQERARVIIEEAVSQVMIRNGGGSTPPGATLRAQLEAAALRAADRRYPRFAEADDSRWDRVITKLKSGGGAGAALEAVGHTGEVTEHRVVKEVQALVSGTGTKASEVVATLSAAPFGWSEDALKAAFGLLIEGGHAHATMNGTPADLRQLLAVTGSRWSTTVLRSESVVLTQMQKIQARQMLTTLLGSPSDPVTNDNLIAKTGEAMTLLKGCADALSGEAPWPQVVLPDAVERVQALAGNGRVLAFLEVQDELTEVADHFAAMAGRREVRETAYRFGQELSSALASVSQAAAVRKRLEGFAQTRDLLTVQDGISPIVTDLTTVARDAVNAVRAEMEAARSTARESLEASEPWIALDDDQRAKLLARSRLSPDPAPDLTDAASVLSTLRARPLPGWADAVDAVASQRAKLFDEAVRLTTPQARTVALPGATVRTPEDIDAYLGRLRTQLTQALDGAPVVVVTGS